MFRHAASWLGDERLEAFPVQFCRQLSKLENVNQISAAHVSVTPFRQKFRYLNARRHDS